MNNPNISVLGFPIDEHSSFLRGPGKAPQKILDAYYSERTNKFSENGIDLGSQNLWDNKGLVKLSTGEQGINAIRDSILAELQKGSDVFPWEAIIPLRFLLSRLIEEYFIH